RGERRTASALGGGGPAVLARPVAGRPRLRLVVEEDEVLLTRVPAVVAGREAEDLRALYALVAIARLSQPVQAVQLHALQVEDLLLRLRAAAPVVADHPVRAHHSVARDEVRDRVVRKRGADRAHRSRVTDLTRDPAVGPDLAARNLECLEEH